MKQSQSKDQQILAAAKACFIRKGIHRTTMRDIATEAGISLGGTYLYFKNKDALIQRFIETGNTESAEIPRMFEQGLDFKASLNLLAGIIFTDLTQNKELPIYLDIVAEALRDKQVAKLLGKGTTKAIIEEVFSEAAAKGQLKLSPKAAASVFMGSIEHLASEFLLKPKLTRRECLAQLAEIIARM